MPTRIVLALTVMVVAACGNPSVTVEAPPDPAEVAWIYHGQVESTTDGKGASVITEAGTWSQEWADLGFDGERPEVDFDHWVVLLLGQADDACPDDLIGLEVVDGGLEVEWLPPPGGCIEPLIMRVHAVAVHRGHLTESFTYGLDEPFADELEPTTITLPPYDGDAPPPPKPPEAMSDEEIDAIFAGHAVPRCGPEHELRRTGEVDGPLSDDPEVAAAQKERAKFGVASDQATVRELLENPPPAGVEDFGFPLTPEELAADRQANARIEDAMAWLAEQGYDERRVVPMIDRSDGIRAALVAGEDDAADLRERLDARFGEGAVAVRVSPWPPLDVTAATDALAQRMHEIERHAQVSWMSGPSGPAEIGLIDPTREALDVIADIVDPNLVCVSVETSGVRVAPAG